MELKFLPFHGSFFSPPSIPLLQGVALKIYSEVRYNAPLPAYLKHSRALPDVRCWSRIARGPHYKKSALHVCEAMQNSVC